MPYEYKERKLGTTMGMGLGLLICYSIIKRHGGYILVNSEVGIGTIVTVYLPAEHETQAP